MTTRWASKNSPRNGILSKSNPRDAECLACVARYVSVSILCLEGVSGTEVFACPSGSYWGDSVHVWMALITFGWRFAVCLVWRSVCCPYGGVLTIVMCIQLYRVQLSSDPVFTCICYVHVLLFLGVDTWIWVTSFLDLINPAIGQAGLKDITCVRHWFYKALFVHKICTPLPII